MNIKISKILVALIKGYKAISALLIYNCREEYKMKIVDHGFSGTMMLAREIETGVVFTGSIGGAFPSVYFKGTSFVTCLKSGLHWTKYKDDEWDLKIHNYTEHENATLTL